MSLPDLDDPLNLDVAAQARNQPDAFAITAKYWTWVYANPHKPVHSGGRIAGHQRGEEEDVKRLQSLINSLCIN